MFSKNTVLVSSFTNPFVNQTLGSYLTQKYLQNNYNNKILFLSSSHNGVFIGKNQNCWKECNMKAMSDDKIPLIRRESGGGTTFVDKGNRLFSFIKKFDGNVKTEYTVIIDALRNLGFDAKFRGKNDIMINDKKISGSAYYISNGVLKHHGTILIDVNKDKLEKYLNPNKLKLISNGIESNKQRIINLKEIRQDITIEKLDAALINSFKKFNGMDTEVIQINDDFIKDKELFNTIYKKYKSNEFIFNNNPSFDHFLENKFSFGMLEIQFNCENNIIKNCHIYSDAVDIYFIDKLKAIFHQQNYDLDNLSELREKLILEIGEKYIFETNEIFEWLKKNL